MDTQRLILLIIFVAQNTGNVRLSFLWMEGQISLALAMLIALQSASP